MADTRSDDRFPEWLSALEKRHLERLTPTEVRRSLQAISLRYVERRRDAPLESALATPGKRAAYALFYGPLHFLLVREIVRRLEPTEPHPARILDLGCGSGAAGAAWALEAGGKAEVIGVDRQAWAIEETPWTLAALGLRGRATRGRLEAIRLPRSDCGILAAFTINEMPPVLRDRLLPRLIEAARRGARVLVVEPVAKRATPWWESWAAEFVRAGGREDAWRFPVRLPDILERLDRAAGLDHHELTARSLWFRGDFELRTTPR